MKELTQLQMKILHTVLEAGEFEATETLYDIVEEVRPTLDDEGEELDDMDPYETSREEIGALENEGYLLHDDNTNLGMGKSLLTDKGRELAEKIVEMTIYSIEGTA